MFFLADLGWENPTKGEKKAQLCCERNEWEIITRIKINHTFSVNAHRSENTANIVNAENGHNGTAVKMVGQFFLRLVFELLNMYDSLVFNLNCDEIEINSWVKWEKSKFCMKREKNITKLSKYSMQSIWKWKICNGFGQIMHQNKPWIKIIACNFTIIVGTTIRHKYTFILFRLYIYERITITLCPGTRFLSSHQNKTKLNMNFCCKTRKVT